MYKVQLDVINDANKNDIIVFDGEHWKSVSRDMFLVPLTHEIIRLQQRVSALEARLDAVERELAYNRGELDNLEGDNN